jgi:integrase
VTTRRSVPTWPYNTVFEPKGGKNTVKIPKPHDGEPIRLVMTKTGEPRYRVVLDAEPYPNGRRKQERDTFANLTAARQHVAAHKSDRARGTLITRNRQTFRAYAEGWLIARSRRVREVTWRAYRGSLDRALNAFGDKQLSAVSRADIESVISGLVEAGRAKRTADHMLFVLRSVFEQALDDGLIARNPARRVQAAGKPAQERQALTAAEMGRLRIQLADDPLFACWLLSLFGLRRSEVLGLRWSDVDLTAGTIRVERGRVAVDGKRTVETPPKTRRGRRTVFMSAELAEAMRALREQQAAQFGFDHVRTGYLAVDAAGRPVRPERWSDLWREHCVAAGVPSVTLHAARHSSVTAMRNAGVPDHVVAAHHGHDEYVMRSVYSHGQDDQLAAAAEALSTAYGSA